MLWFFLQILIWILSPSSCPQFLILTFLRIWEYSDYQCESKKSVWKQEMGLGKCGVSIDRAGDILSWKIKTCKNGGKSYRQREHFPFSFRFVMSKKIRKMRKEQVKETKSHRRKLIWVRSTIVTRENSRVFNTNHVNTKLGMVKRYRKIPKTEKNFTILYGLVRLLSILFSS